MSLFSPPTAWVPGIELWLPGPGQVSLPVRPSCYAPTSVQKPHTLPGCDAEHVEADTGDSLAFETRLVYKASSKLV